MRSTEEGETPEPGGQPGSEAAGAFLREPFGLVRERLVNRLSRPDTYSAGIIVAPAGSGKSRLLAHVAHVYPGPVAWCGTPEPIPRTEGAFVSWLCDSTGSWASMVLPVPSTVAELVRQAAPRGRAPVLVVIDDVHLLEASDAETALAELVVRAPGGMRLLLAARVDPSFDLSRLRVSGRLVEIRQDDLRFRTWEVEELFRDVYRDPLVPEDVGTLARRTGGWAAYLQLFHLATARKLPAARRQALATLSRQPRLVTDYLSRQVLAQLSPELQEFLLRTSVLRRPSGRLCDELFGRQGGSAALLAELERRQLFTERLEDGTYRYHTVLLSHLDALLVESIGLEAARAEHRRAGQILEREGLGEEALAAYAKSQDWVSVARILGHAGASVDTGDAWLEALPPTVIASDPLLLMARARRLLAIGAVEETLRTLKEAETSAASSVLADRCREQRERLSEWASPDLVKPLDDCAWTTLLRAATQRDPLGVQARAAGLQGAHFRFVEGLAAFLAGDWHAAARTLRALAKSPASPPWMGAAARMASCVIALLSGESVDAEEIDRARDEVDTIALPWLTRVARVALLGAGAPSLSPREQTLPDMAAEFIESCKREGDRWGAALISLVYGMSTVVSGAPDCSMLSRAALSFSELGARSLAATAAGFEAVAERQLGNAQAAVEASGRARVLGFPGAPLPYGLALLVEGVEKGDLLATERAQSILAPVGAWELAASLVPPGGTKAAAPRGPGELTASGSPAVDDPPASLKCLGGFALTIGGRVLDESLAKPMERSLLHLLSARVGEKVHREEIVEALWPEADPHAGRHRLQVAVSSLRRLLSQFSDGLPLLAREGDNYSLVLPAGADVDTWRVEGHLRAGANARFDGDVVTECSALSAAVMSYGGSLLPMDGPAEWAQAPRLALQTAVADAATRLAHLLAEGGDYQGAAEMARRGLSVDRFRDELWRIRIDAAERSGNQADATRTRRAYDDVLVELGVAPVH